MWKAKNKQTGRTYLLKDDQKVAYESSPHTAGKYTFTQIEEPSAPKKLSPKVDPESIAPIGEATEQKDEAVVSKSKHAKTLNDGN